VSPLKLLAPQVDSDLQLVPLLCQAKIICLKGRVDVNKLFPKPAQCIDGLLKNVMADSATPARDHQRMTEPLFGAGGCRGDVGYFLYPAQRAGDRRTASHFVDPG
jgi:hypothetical protein